MVLSYHVATYWLFRVLNDTAPDRNGLFAARQVAWKPPKIALLLIWVALSFKGVDWAVFSKYYMMTNGLSQYKDVLPV